MSRLVTVKLPEKMVRAIDVLVKMGIYTNRSEFIRAAVREKLERELGKGVQISDRKTGSSIIKEVKTIE